MDTYKYMNKVHTLSHDCKYLQNILKGLTKFQKSKHIGILSLKKWQNEDTFLTPLALFISQPFSTFVQVYCISTFVQTHFLCWLKDKIFYVGQSQPLSPLSRYCKYSKNSVYVHILHLGIS